MKLEQKKFGFTILVSLLIVSSILLTWAVHAEDQIGGIGLWVTADDHALLIVNVLSNTPASKAGLVPGLVIQKIEGTATADKRTEDCIAMIRGPVGTTVKLELFDKANNKTNTVVLTREPFGR